MNEINQGKENGINFKRGNLRNLSKGKITQNLINGYTNGYKQALNNPNSNANNSKSNTYKEFYNEGKEHALVNKKNVGNNYAKGFIQGYEEASEPYPDDDDEQEEQEEQEQEEQEQEETEEAEEVESEENEQKQNNKNKKNNHTGGAKDYSGTYRNFKIVQLNGKDVKFDYSSKIKETQTPLNAAKKLLKSICLHMGLKGMKKLQCNAKFVIKETTQGSEKKMFGPYKGSYIKYTPAEAKKAMASGISFKMKPSVKLSKKMSPKNK